MQSRNRGKVHIEVGWQERLSLVDGWYENRIDDRQATVRERARPYVCEVEVSSRLDESRTSRYCVRT